MEDVTTLTSLGLNFYELDGDGGHVYRRIKVTRAPGYMIGSNADCFHSIDVGVGPSIVDSELGYCLDDFFNIHNTIHLLFPPPGNASANSTRAMAASAAVLVNPRIWCGGMRGFAFNDTQERQNPLDLDLWYGDTSPMSNIKPGVDKINCYSVNVNAERFGGPITVESATLVRDLARTSAAAMEAFRSSASKGALPLMGWCAMEVWDLRFSPGSLAGWEQEKEPVIMCDISRFTATGATIRNTSFHHSTCNVGRMKASHSVMIGNTWTVRIRLA
jgi:hypothetical protein